MSEDKTLGTIKWFNTEKGYGFISVAGMEKDVFLHVKQLRAAGIMGSPTEGQPITFALKDGPKGKFAADIAKA